MPTIADIRADFPILAQQIHGHPLTYLDNTASSQKPAQVIEAMDRYYRQQNANVHRGVHTLSETATAAYENARLRVARFINAANPKQVIFTRNTTESLNLVAYSWGRANLKPGDEVLITEMEHHSNIVPWQLICEITGATLRFVPITPHGELDEEALPALLSERTKVFAFTAMSNVLGTINPIERVAAATRSAGIPLLVEKPLARTLRETEELVQSAQKRGTLLQVGHIERFNPALSALDGMGLLARASKARAA